MTYGEEWSQLVSLYPFMRDLPVNPFAFIWEHGDTCRVSPLSTTVAPTLESSTRSATTLSHSWGGRCGKRGIRRFGNEGVKKV